MTTGELIQTDNIAAVVAAILTLSLALSAAVGPVVMYLTEAIKAAYGVRAGAGGLIALAIAVMLGVALGALAGLLAQPISTGEMVAYAVIGAFAGVFIAGGAVQAYKASALVNADKSFAIVEARKADEAEAKLTTAAEQLRNQAEKDRLRPQTVAQPTKIVEVRRTEPAAPATDGSVGSAVQPDQADGGIAAALVAGPSAGDTCDCTSSPG